MDHKCTAGGLADRIRSGLKRRPASGGYARGDEKRERIVEAALRCFGEDGYLGASTRRIAQEAGVNPPAIQYYFDGKEGLYRACTAHVMAQLRHALAAPYAAADSAAEAPAALDALIGLIEAIAVFLLGTSEDRGWGPFLARAQTHDDSGPKDEEVGLALRRELHQRCIRLTGIVIGRPAEAPETIIRAFMVMGQMASFSFLRADVMALLGLTRFEPAHLATLKAMLRHHTTMALAAPGPG